MTRNPSGHQWTIRRGQDEAVLVEVGGGLRTLRVGGHEIVAGYAVDEMAPSGRGQVLMPWPNRLRDGQFSFGGQDLQLPLTEPRTHNASHGLVRWTLWEVLAEAADVITLGYRLHPVPGWPWPLDLRQTYRLVDGGLHVTSEAENVGDEPAPFGFGAHPYLAIGETPVTDVVLQIPAGRAMTTDERSLPAGLVDVAGGELDFRTPRALGGTVLDTAYTDVSRDADGRWRVVLSGLRDLPDLCVWGGPGLDWLQVFTAKAQPDMPAPRGIAVEPMSCPADALRSGTDLAVLQPGESWRAEWGISLA